MISRVVVVAVQFRALAGRCGEHRGPAAARARLGLRAICVHVAINVLIGPAAAPKALHLVLPVPVAPLPASIVRVPIHLLRRLSLLRAAVGPNLFGLVQTAGPGGCLFSVIPGSMR